MAAYQYIYVMKGLTKIYPGGRKVLENIWLSFLPGAKIGVLGHNGSGKSTLLKIMAGLDKDMSRARPGWRRAPRSAFCSRSRSSTPRRTVQENIIEGMGEAAQAHAQGSLRGGLQQAIGRSHRRRLRSTRC